MILLAIFFPGIYFLFRGKIFSAIFAIVLQIIAILTFLVFGIGVIISIAISAWAVLSYINHKNAKKLEQMEKRIIASQIA
jgi:hypothetical protein